MKNVNLQKLRRPLLVSDLVLAAWAGLMTLSTSGAARSASNETKSASNETRPTEAVRPLTVPAGREAATFAGGCFWAMQAEFEKLKGVDSVTAGYAGGHTANPTYETVCTDTTGYAETVQIIYNPRVISYRDLVGIFLTAHDPTTPDRQGNDAGTQYRSAIFYHSQSQAATAKQVVAEMTRARVYSAPIVTQIVPYTGFYKAEDYHQDYFAQNPDEPYCRFTVAPEVARFQALNKARLKS